jgi:hypothetical protein
MARAMPVSARYAETQNKKRASSNPPDREVKNISNGPSGPRFSI